MDELYTLMEEMLDDEYNLECIQNVLSLKLDKYEDISKDDLLSVIYVTSQAVKNSVSRYKENISALDRYITHNGSKYRNSNTVTQSGTDE